MRLGSLCFATLLLDLPLSAALKPTGSRQAAPEFMLKDAAGSDLRLSELRGKVVLLNFWATWCVPCRVEVPWFVEFQKTYTAQGFSVLGVSLDEMGWEAVRPYVAAQRINYPVLLGNEPLAKLYGGLDALPTTLLLDKQGRVAALYRGPIKKKQVAAEIDQLLKE